MDTFECRCCLEAVDVEEEVRCTERVAHSFCVGCAMKQMELDTLDGKPETGCLMGRACEGVFSHVTRDRVVVEVGRRRAEREEVERAVYAAGLEGFWKCPFCDFGAICEDVEGETVFWCRNEWCQRTSCRQCQREAHPGVLCDGATEAEAVSGVTTRCPACGRALSRAVHGEEGRNVVYCPCQIYMPVCMACGRDLREQHLEHFRYMYEGEIPGGAQDCALYTWGLFDPGT